MGPYITTFCCKTVNMFAMQSSEALNIPDCHVWYWQEFIGK